MSTKQALINHYNTYPSLQIRDVFKFLFQSTFGCEHLASSKEKAKLYIQSELCTFSDGALWRADPLDGDYSRVHLSVLGGNLSPEILAEYFCLSARTEPCGKERLEEKLTVARSLIEDGTLPLSLSDFDREHALWREAGYPPIHHSDVFRDAYAPHYRVIANEYIAKLLDIFRSGEG